MFSFNEPGLLENLSEKNDFPKNIKEDEEFPEFISLIKRKSGSFVTFNKKKYIFYETKYD